ncbi:hypothetical protein AHF37_08854 [Paragonimus kellicotti]|nr:hypothetical protein AHF37_08854 [Paragonimus kellicotti]
MSDLMDAAERLQNGTSVKSEHATSLAYYSLSAATRTKVLLSLLESQFDRNQGFRDKVNVRPSVDLRFRPLGSDVWGRIYWLLKDSEVNVLLYREDTEDETILLICENTNEIRELHDRLKDVCPSEPNLATILASRKRASPSGDTSPPSTGLTSVVAGLITAQIASTESDQIDQNVCSTVEILRFHPHPSLLHLPLLHLPPSVVHNFRLHFLTRKHRNYFSSWKTLKRKKTVSVLGKCHASRMTNILADNEDDEGIDKTIGGRRRRHDHNAVSVGAQSEDSQTSSQPVNSHSSSVNSISDEEVHKRSGRSVRRPLRSRSARNFGFAHRNSRLNGRAKRMRLDSSSDEDEDDSISEDSSVYAPRSTRRKEAHYNMNDAFKQLDEALEADEKYQEKKRLRKTRKLTVSDEEGGSQEDTVQPAGRSRGKDLSNILGPNWKEFESTKARSKRRRRENQTRKPETQVIHNSDDNDVDFQPSSTSLDDSKSAEEEEEEEGVSTDSVSSENSWLCSSRRRNLGPKRVARKRNSHRSSNFPRRRGRPVPRFEESENGEPDSNDSAISKHNGRTRPRRCARNVISYRESDDDDQENGSCASTTNHPTTHMRRDFFEDEEEHGEPERSVTESDLHMGRNDESDGKPPTPVSRLVRSAKVKRRRRMLSSDSDYRPEADDEVDRIERETVESKGKLTRRNGLSSEDVSSASSTEHDDTTRLKIIEPTPETSPINPTCAAVDSVLYPSGLLSAKTVDRLLDPVKSTVSAASIGVPQQDDDEEEAVEDEADDLLPVRPLVCADAALNVSAGFLHSPPDLFE